MYNILVSDSMSETGLAPLLKAEHVEVTRQKAAEVKDLDRYDALLVRSATKVTAELLEKMPRLKIIGRAGVGVDNIDVDEATKRGIIVINAPDGNTISTAEHTFAMIASMLRNIPQANASVKAGKWERNRFLGNELYGKNLGIIGMGRIGTELAKRAAAFGMNLHVFDPYLTKSRAEKMGVIPGTLEEVLETADIITVHTPLTRDTKGLLNMETLGRTKQGVYIANCARGGIIDEEALVHYLEQGHVAGAAFDVFVEEPPAGHPFLDFDQVIMTPHIGASTKEAQLLVAEQVSKEVLQFLEGLPVKSSINLPALSKEVYTKIEPFYKLSKTMGTILSQCMKEPVQEVEISYAGEIADLETSVVTRSLLSGFLKPRVDSPVNEVNAAVIAKERGISFSEKINSSSQGYSNLIEAIVHGEDSSFFIRGTFIKEYGPRILNLNGFEIDFYPQGNLLYVQHSDRPGVIGKVGNILGEHGVNIATMQVGRKQAGGDAIMMLSFDRSLDDNLVKELDHIEFITSVRKIEV